MSDDKNRTYQACGVPLKHHGGTPCSHPRYKHLGCCRSHLGHWALDNPGRLMEVFRLFRGRVSHIQPRSGSACGVEAIDRFPEIEIHVGGESWKSARTPIRMHVEDAEVMADYLASLGDQDVCERILAAIPVAVEEWPERLKWLRSEENRRG